MNPVRSPLCSDLQQLFVSFGPKVHVLDQVLKTICDPWPAYLCSHLLSAISLAPYICLTELFFFFSQLFKSITLIEARTAVTSVGELPGIWEKRKAWSVLKLFSISIVLYITWVYTYVKISSCTLKTGTSYFI